MAGIQPRPTHSPTQAVPIAPPMCLRLPPGTGPPPPGSSPPPGLMRCQPESPQNLAEPQDGYEPINANPALLPPPPPISGTAPNASKQLADDVTAAEPWYHGLLPRQDLKLLLKKNGDFLVRTSEPVPGEDRQLILSVQCREDYEEQGIKSYVIKTDIKVRIEKLCFDTVSELIIHHLKTKVPVTTKLEANCTMILVTPIGRQPWELEHGDVECTKKLGEGAFGEVQMGKLNWKCSLTKQTKVITVAVKLAKLEVLTKEQIKEIMTEARMMRNFNHPNVVKFYGVAAGKEPLMLVMELVDGGSLDSFLKKAKPPHPITLKNEMVLQAANGLAYLHKFPVIHRDIAARNLLYGDKRVRISDFGLTRRGTVYRMDPSKRVPIRWLAPETISTYFYTHKSDVWSFGILCWEIYNNAEEPYGEHTPAEVREMLKNGYRLDMPPGVAQEVVHIIKNKCWAENMNERFDMDEVVKWLNRALPNGGRNVPPRASTIVVAGQAKASPSVAMVPPKQSPSVAMVPPKPSPSVAMVPPKPSPSVGVIVASQPPKPSPSVGVVVASQPPKPSPPLAPVPAAAVQPTQPRASTPVPTSNKLAAPAAQTPTSQIGSEKKKKSGMKQVVPTGNILSQPKKRNASFIQGPTPRTRASKPPQSQPEPAPNSDENVSEARSQNPKKRQFVSGQPSDDNAVEAKTQNQRKPSMMIKPMAPGTSEKKKGLSSKNAKNTPSSIFPPNGTHHKPSSERRRSNSKNIQPVASTPPTASTPHKEMGAVK